MSSNGLPEHIPIYVQKCALPAFWDELKDRGFRNTFFQIVSPRQIYGKITTINFDGIESELHIRCLVNGSEYVRIIGEFEPKRLGNVVQHLSKHSYSAHEYIIDTLGNLGINFQVDQSTRLHYNENRSKKFIKQKYKFFNWLFVGVFFTLPRGIMWRIYFEITSRIKKKTLFADCN